MKYLTQEFRARDVHRATNINKETLRVWRRRGYVYGADLGKGEDKGGWTQFSFIGIVATAVMLEVTSRHRIDASQAHSYFLKGASGFFLHEAVDAFATGRPDVWVFVVLGNVDEHGGYQFQPGQTQDPATIFTSVSRPSSALAVNVGEIIRQVVARLDAPHDDAGDDEGLGDAD